MPMGPVGSYNGISIMAHVLSPNTTATRSSALGWCWGAWACPPGETIPFAFGVLVRQGRLNLRDAVAFGILGAVGADQIG